MLETLKEANLKRWKAMTVNTNAVATLDKVALRLNEAKDRYQKVEAKTGVPWPIIAVTHEREASQNWMANLAQGDRWDRVSTHVPRGQGPFKSWEEAAINAVKEFKWTDWSTGGMLTFLERYNGLGYSKKGRPSPYVWSKTNQYVAGKYVADGVYDANAVDKQMGCAAMLVRMNKLDPSIGKYGWFGKSATPTITPATGVVPTITTVGTGTAVAVWHFKDYWPEITIGAVVVGVAVYALIRWYKSKNRKLETNV